MNGMRVVMMSLEPIDRADFFAFAADRGLKLWADVVFTDDIRQSEWVDSDRRLTFGSVSASGCVLIVAAGDPSLAAEVSERFALMSVPEVFAWARQHTIESDVIRAIFVMDSLRLAPTGEGERLERFIADKLSDDRPLVRWAAAERLASSLSDDTEAAMAAAAQQHEDLLGTLQWIREGRAAQVEGTLWDTPTDAWWELLERARDGAEEGKWKRVERAMDQLLDACPDHVEGLYLRALAYEARGDFATALCLLAGSDAASEWRDEEELNEAVHDATVRARTRVEAALEERAPIVDVDHALQRMTAFRASYHDSLESAAASALCPFVSEGSRALFLYLAAGAGDEIHALLEAHRASPRRAYRARCAGAGAARSRRPRRRRDARARHRTDAERAGFARGRNAAGLPG